MARDGNGEGLGKRFAMFACAGEDEPGDAASGDSRNPEAGGCGDDSRRDQRQEVLIPCPSASLPMSRSPISALGGT